MIIFTGTNLPANTKENNPSIEGNCKFRKQKSGGNMVQRGLLINYRSLSFNALATAPVADATCNF